MDLRNGWCCVEARSHWLLSGWWVPEPGIMLIIMSDISFFLVLINLPTQGVLCVCQRTLVLKATSTTSSTLEPILTINGVYRAGDLGMLGQEGATCNHGMLNLKDDICDHGNVSKDAKGGDTSAVRVLTRPPLSFPPSPLTRKHYFSTVHKRKIFKSWLLNRRFFFLIFHFLSCLSFLSFFPFFFTFSSFSSVFSCLSFLSFFHFFFFLFFFIFFTIFHISLSHFFTLPMFSISPLLCVFSFWFWTAKPRKRRGEKSTTTQKKRTPSSTTHQKRSGKNRGGEGSTTWDFKVLNVGQNPPDPFRGKITDMKKRKEKNTSKNQNYKKRRKKTKWETQ